MKYYLLTLIAAIVALIIVGNVIGIKALVLSISVFSAMMFFNIVMTTLGKAFQNSNINVNYDIFWKLLFMTISSIGFGIYFNI